MKRASATLASFPIAGPRLMGETAWMIAKYDRIGLTYAELRKRDQRIAAAIEATLGWAETVLNVGTGTGSYENFRADDPNLNRFPSIADSGELPIE